MKHILIIISILVIGLTSCSKRDYVNAIPANSTALVSVSAEDFVGEQSPFASLLMPFVDNDTKRMKGIDLTREIYLFASGDGNLGACAPVADGGELADFIERLQNLDILKNHTEQDGKDFYTINGQWVLGHDDYTLLIMGPVTGADAEARLIRSMARQMEKDDEESIRNSMLWQHLQERRSNIRMVAQASALPEQISQAITLGAPKGTSADDVLLEADLSYKEGTLQLSGTTCSYNPNIRQALKKSHTLYNPITVDWQRIMGDSAVIGIFMNVKGQELMPQIQGNRQLNTMLMGTGSYDKIRTNDGNLAILLQTKPATDEGKGMFATTILNLPDEHIHNEERLVVAVNIEALAGPLEKTVAPYLGKVKRIIYNMNTEQ